MAKKLQKYRKTPPKIAVLLETSHEISRGMLRGIFKYIRIYGDWRIELNAGGASDCHLPDARYWKGDGIIARIPNEQLAQEIVNSGLPCVLIDPSDEFLDPMHPLSRFPSVRCDSRAVGIMAAEFLMNLGFDHYGFVPMREPFNWSRARQKSFSQALDASRYSCYNYPGPAERTTPWVQEVKTMIPWLRKLPKPIALFAANDHRARQVLDACIAASIHVPYEVSILGVNNDEMPCQSTFPPLSSIALDAQEGGFLAASYMNDLLRGKTFRGPGSYLEFQPTSVVTRGSTTQGISLSPKIIRALEFIRTNAGLNLRVDDIAHHLGVTRQWAEKLFQKERKCSIHEEIHHVRMNTIRSMVARTTLPFNEIALQCGFESGNHLGILFKKHFGMTMTEYRSRATSENESLEQVSIIKDGSFHILD